MARAWATGAWRANAWAGTVWADSSVTTISATPGTYTWAGVAASLSGVINATPGTWTWAGRAATTTQLLNATPGTYTWAGKAATTNQLLNATPGAWMWQGVPAGVVVLLTVSATPGAWAWVGVSSQVTTPGAPNPNPSSTANGPRIARRRNGEIMEVLFDADGLPYAAKRKNGTVLLLTQIAGTNWHRALTSRGDIVTII